MTGSPCLCLVCRCVGVQVRAGGEATQPRVVVPGVHHGHQRGGESQGKDGRGRPSALRHRAQEVTVAATVMASVVAPLHFAIDNLSCDLYPYVQLQS